MLHIRTRRLLGLCVTLLFTIAAVACVWLVQTRLGHSSMMTGWTLLSCVGLLMLLGFRKKLVMLPLLSVRIWTQFHIYTGLFSVAVYVMHVPAIIASGFFESTLSLLFLGVSCSGLYGVWISRRGAKRLTSVPGEYRFDQFGWHRRKIADRAWDILDELGESADVPVLADFYSKQLQHYFSARPSLAYVVVPTGLKRRKMLAELGELDRYFSGGVKQAAGRMAALIRTRDDLDFHYATQLRMRLWLAVHVAMTFAMIIFTISHVLLVLRFQGN